MQVAIVYSLPSQRMLSSKYRETDEDTAVIAEKVKLGLESRGMMCSLYPIREAGIEEILAIKADCIFNLIEWCGLDIGLARKAFGYLRKLGVAVTGSSEELYVLTGDKARMKPVLQKMGIPTPEGQVFETGEESIKHFSYPVIVKPSLEHCSTGLSYDSIVDHRRGLRKIVKKSIQDFAQSVLVEKFVDGREFLVYLIEELTKVRILPIEEVIFRGDHKRSFQTYGTKWDQSSADYKTTDVVVAQLTPEEQKAIESTSTRAFEKLGLRGYARFDLRYRDGIPYILETNANPSVYDGDGSLSDPNEEVIPGIKFSEYLQKIVESALFHYEQGDEI